MLKFIQNVLQKQWWFSNFKRRQLLEFKIHNKLGTKNVISTMTIWAARYWLTLTNWLNNFQSSSIPTATHSHLAKLIILFCQIVSRQSNQIRFWWTENDSCKTLLLLLSRNWLKLLISLISFFHCLKRLSWINFDLNKLIRIIVVLIRPDFLFKY